LPEGVKRRRKPKVRLSLDTHQQPPDWLSLIPAIKMKKMVGVRMSLERWPSEKLLLNATANQKSSLFSGQKNGDTLKVRNLIQIDDRTGR